MVMVMVMVMVMETTSHCEGGGWQRWMLSSRKTRRTRPKQTTTCLPLGFVHITVDDAPIECRRSFTTDPTGAAAAATADRAPCGERDGSGKRRVRGGIRALFSLCTASVEGVGGDGGAHWAQLTMCWATPIPHTSGQVVLVLPETRHTDSDILRIPFPTRGTHDETTQGSAAEW